MSRGASLTPLQVFRVAAATEAFTWAGLLVGMFLKRVTHTTELGVQVFGMLHGVAFVAFCLVTVLVAVDQRWSTGRALLGLASAVPPFFTIVFERYAERRGLLDDRWHSAPETSETTTQRVVCWLRNHRAALGGFAVAVAALTGLALLVGPPVG
jgi:integral membrane protein